MDPKIITGAATFLLCFILEKYMPHYSPRTHRLKHSLYNLSMIVINGSLGILIFAGLNSLVFGYTGGSRFGILYIQAIPRILRPAAAFIIFDIWMYAWHMANHRVPFLWLFHRSHHNDPEMDASTSLRLHPAEIIISSVVRLPVYALIGMDAHILAVYEAVLMSSILFHHSNISLPPWLDRLLRIFIVTPDMHRVHHSWKRTEINTNFSSVTSVWDRLFGTYKYSGDTKSITLGLPGYREDTWQTPWGILTLPLEGFAGREKEGL